VIRIKINRGKKTGAEKGNHIKIRMKKFGNNSPEIGEREAVKNAIAYRIAKEGDHVYLGIER